MQTNTLEVAIDDPGLLYGATVFTTLRVYHQSLDGALTNWVEHCDRLRTSLQILGWQQPAWNRLRQGAEMLMAHLPVLRITVFSDGREWITGRVLPIDLAERQYHGVKVSLVSGQQHQRYLPTHKTGNYLSAWLAKINAQQMAAQEAILVDAGGNWLETSTGNIWGWREGSWWTPPVEAGILPGVVRLQLINWLKHQQILVKEEPWSSKIVKGFEAIAYTNSVVEVVPIHTVLKQQGMKGEITQTEYNPYHSAFKQLRGLFVTTE